MPILTMADGSEVEVPDNPTPELKERIRAKNEQIKSQMASQEQQQQQQQQQQQPAPPRQSAASQPTLDRALANQQVPEQKSMAQSLGNIGTAALTGAVAGAGTAETMGIVGKGLQMVPWTPAKAAGAALQAAAPLAAGLGARTGAAVIGAASSAGGQAVTEGLESAGLPRMYAVPAGIAATMAVPLAESVVSSLRSGAGSAWKAVRTLASGAEESIPRAVTAARKVLSADPLAREPQLQVAASLAKAQGEHMAKAKADAAKLVDNARAEGAKLFRTDPEAARRVVQAAEAESKRIVDAATAQARALERASTTDLAKASQVKAKADGALQKVSPVVPPSDTGNLIRGKILPKHQELIGERNAQYKALESERNALVAAKEQSGQLIGETKAMQELRADLKALLFPKAGDTAKVTDAGTRASLEKIWAATGTQRRQVGVDAVGNPTYASNPVSFEALDGVRRKLGDVAFGKEAEGYSALGQQIAKRYYAKLSKAQEEFAGPIQRQLQGDYSTAMEGLGIYRGQPGKAVLATDRHSEAFRQDAAAIPGSFFRSQQTVRDLLELTGDAQVVATAARQHAVRELAGKDGKQVAAWLKDPKNVDWMREVPGLQQDLARYAAELGVIERSAAKLTARGEAAGKRAGEVLPEAQKLAEATAAKAGKRAEELRKAASGEQKQAAALVKQAEGQAAKDLQKAEAAVKELALGDFPVEGVNNLLRSGSGAKQAAALIVREPGGDKALEKSLRSLMSGMGREKLQRFWAERGIDIVEGALGKQAANRIGADVKRVLAAYEGRDALTRVQKILSREFAALAGYGVGQTGLGAWLVKQNGG